MGRNKLGLDCSKREKPLEGKKKKIERDRQRATPGFLLVSAPTGVQAHRASAPGLPKHEGKVKTEQISETE